MKASLVDAPKVLSTLKSFQLDTVDYAFSRLYGSAPVDRFLIADEMGLGKTMVAKGLIAQAVEKLQHTVKRIDIIYICSNRDIASQNISRLNIGGEDDAPDPNRLTLLPLYAKDLDRRMNFISFTPGTSFDLRSRAGWLKERALIYRLLRDGWGLGGTAGPRNLLQGPASRDSWAWWIDWVYEQELNEDLARSFIHRMEGTQLRKDFDAAVDLFKHYRKRSNHPSETREEQNRIIGELRVELAKCCLGKLEPDVIILDEFQRFRDLLDEKTEMGQLAHSLFNCKDAKIVLLSATPYKMYSMGHEGEDGSASEDHYRDFIDTADFLFRGQTAEVSGLKDDIAKFRRALLDYHGQGKAELPSARASIERRLQQVMVRTERLASTTDRNGMLAPAVLDAPLEPGDIRAFSTFDAVARCVKAGDAVEYWKAIPYPLNMMDQDYVLKRRFKKKAAAGELDNRSKKRLKACEDGLLRWSSIEKYRPIDPNNAKLRTLLKNTTGKGAWKLLWVPPSYPYYASPGSPFEAPEVRGFTKGLVFSAWRAIPRAIASLCSYEAERLAAAAVGAKKDYSAEHRPLIVFSLVGGKPRGMNSLTLMYPCVTLATEIDPLAIAVELHREGKTPTADLILAAAKAKLSRIMEPILKTRVPPAQYSQTGEREAPERWFSAALALMDAQRHKAPVQAWLNSEDEEARWEHILGQEGEEAAGIQKHLEDFWLDFGHVRWIGKPPDDLIDVLAKVAIGSPAVIALRALLRLATPEQRKSPPSYMLPAAAAVAAGMRSLFNQRDSIHVVRAFKAGEDERYWESVLDYAIAGNLQATMDEYVHVLREYLGLMGKPLEDAAGPAAEEMRAASSIRTVRLDFDEIIVGDRGQVQVEPQSLRCRFALRYGDDRNEGNDEETRREQVRTAFNSPFRPFILASTAVGHEGLDFHCYCHSIYHWNLPVNVVDFEQREGRIHRYKGHVIRKNIVTLLPMAELAKQWDGLVELWEALFGHAKSLCKDPKELKPYWICESAGGCKIQRFVPALPLSRDRDHFKRIQKTLVAYRAVFGQPRQEDLAQFLLRQMADGAISSNLTECRINLEPPERPSPEAVPPRQPEQLRPSS